MPARAAGAGPGAGPVAGIALGPSTPVLFGVNTGLVATEGLEDTLTGGWASEAAEYLAPDASATFCTIPSGVKSLSERAVICTWYPYRDACVLPVSDRPVRQATDREGMALTWRNFDTTAR